MTPQEARRRVAAYAAQMLGTSGWAWIEDEHPLPSDQYLLTAAVRALLDELARRGAPVDALIEHCPICGASISSLTKTAEVDEIGGHPRTMQPYRQQFSTGVWTYEAQPCGHTWRTSVR